MSEPVGYRWRYKPTPDGPFIEWFLSPVRCPVEYPFRFDPSFEERPVFDREDVLHECEKVARGWPEYSWNEGTASGIADAIIALLEAQS